MAEEITQVPPASPRTETKRGSPDSPGMEIALVSPASPRSKTIQVAPASPRTKLRGDDKRRSFEISPKRSSTSAKAIPNYLRASTGSCHEFCKHGIRQEHVTNVKERQPSQKVAVWNGRDILHTKDGRGVAATKMTGLVKPKPLADPKIQSLRQEILVQDILATTSEHFDVPNEQATSDTTVIVSDESTASDGPETTSSSLMVKRETTVPYETVTVMRKKISLDVKDSNSSQKLITSSKKPSSRAPSPISNGLSVDKSMAGRKGLDGKKALERRNSFDGRKSVSGKSCDLNSSSAENNAEGNKNVGGMHSIEGSNVSLEMNTFQSGTSLNMEMETDQKDVGLGNAESELLKTRVAAPKPKFSTIKPSPSLNPPPLKPPSPVHPLSGISSRTNGDNQVTKKVSAFELNAKKIGLSSTLKPPSPVHPLSGMDSRTSNDIQLAGKVSNSKLGAKETTSTLKPPTPVLSLSGVLSRSSNDNQLAEEVSTSKLITKKVVIPSTSRSPSPVNPSSGVRSRTSNDNQLVNKDSISKLDAKKVIYPSALKPPSPIHPLSSVRSKTGEENKADEKISPLNQDSKKVGTSTTTYPSSRSSVSREESTTTKKVSIRVISSMSHESKIIKMKAKDTNVQDVQEDTADSVKKSPEKESLAGNKAKVTSCTSVLTRAPSVSKSTIRSTPSYVSPHLKRSVAESEAKVTAKVVSTSGLRKGKAVDIKSENIGPSTLKMRKTSLPRETSTTYITRPLPRKTDVTGRSPKMNSRSRLDYYPFRQPSMTRKKKGQVLFNKVIEETANRLVRVRKSKVLALVGAFETVITIQKKSSARTKLKPKAKKISPPLKPSR